MSVISFLSRGLALTALTLPVATANDTLIFDAEFDSQENWAPKVRSQRYRFEGDTGSLPDPEHRKPGRFDFYYLSELWHPSEHPDRQPVAQITGDYPGTSGKKAFVMYDESYGAPGAWGADSVMTKDLGNEYDELYLHVRMKFSPDWVWADILQGNGQSTMKLLRCRRHSGISTRSRFSFFGEDARSGSPVAILDLKSWTKDSQNWVRPLVSIRGYSHPDYYKTDRDYFSFGGNYETKIERGVRSNGRLLSWQELFLDGEWHTVGMHLKMDSSPGAEDGRIMVSIDGNTVIEADDVPWRLEGDDPGIGWNECSIGGNIHNLPYEPELRHEQWYAIEEFKIYGAALDRPNPPSDIKVRD